MLLLQRTTSSRWKINIIGVIEKQAGVFKTYPNALISSPRASNLEESQSDHLRDSESNLYSVKYKTKLLAHAFSNVYLYCTCAVVDFSSVLL
jgi:hypothetical protein